MCKFNFIVVLFLLSITISAQSQVTSSEGIVAVKTANVYSGPDTKSTKLRTLNENIQVKILQEQGDWYFISVKGKTGWTEKSNIKLIFRTEEPQINKDETAIKEKPSEQKRPEQINTELPPKVVNPEQDREDSKTYFGKTHYFSPYTFGIKGGINNSQLTGVDAPDNTESRVGFCAGAFFIYRLYKGLGLQGELLYNQKGYVIGDSTSNLDYVSVPVLMRYTLEFGNINPFINAGIEISYLANAGLVTPDKTYVYDDLKKFDTGLAVGGGIGYNLTGISSIILDVRYVIGLSTIHDKTVHDTDELDLKLNVMSITLCFTF